MSAGPPDERPLLTNLDADPVAAAVKFRRLFGELSRWLEWNRCPDADGAASETVYRAVKQSDRLSGMTESDLRGFMFGIAANVAHEIRRRQGREQQLGPQTWSRRASPVVEEERILDRLTAARIRECLDAQDWGLLVRYATDDDHDRLCRELGVTKGALRVKICRIRQKIRNERDS